MPEPQEPRVVSLIASATEILHALGAGGCQVARSHECDYPESVADLPAITRPKFKVDGSSLEIDTRVKSLVEQGLAVYEVDAAALEAAAPGVILTQDQCEVCAVSLADVERAVCLWVGHTATIVSLRPHTMADAYNDIHRVAAALGRPHAGPALVAQMKQRIDAVSRAIAGRPAPKLTFIEWIEPPMSGGHWMPELIAAAGGVDTLGKHGVNSPWITWTDVATADPDVILVAPCGFDLKRTGEEMQQLQSNDAWLALRAVREGRVFIADGNAYFNRPGPRLAETAEIIAEVLHPGLPGFGHRGHAFTSFP